VLFGHDKRNLARLTDFWTAFHDKVLSSYELTFSSMIHSTAKGKNVREREGVKNVRDMQTLV